MPTTQIERSWFSRHHGVITYAEALALGIGRGSVDRRVRSGEWKRMHRGVYRHAAIPVTWQTKALAAVRSTNGLLSHRAAARVWRLEDFAQARVEVVVPEGRQRREPSFILHQSRQFAIAVRAPSMRSRPRASSARSSTSHRSSACDASAMRWTTSSAGSSPPGIASSDVSLTTRPGDGRDADLCV
ncbi:MAG: type IV toxin-antitoxin system AbiEi family antitoxin domain-containing protein [Actinomycetota bacterium]